jgi:peptidoglycan hydrolase-like protein with peptidoglycan-binding domain
VGRGAPWSTGSNPGTSGQNTHNVTSSDKFPIASLKKPLKLGSKGDLVKQLQILLNKKGFIIASSGLGSSGKETVIFGPKTKTAVVKFQKTHHLKPDGVVGPKTWTVLTQ